MLKAQTGTRLHDQLGPEADKALSQTSTSGSVFNQFVHQTAG